MSKATDLLNTISEEIKLPADIKKVIKAKIDKVEENRPSGFVVYTDDFPTWDKLEMQKLVGHKMFSGMTGTKSGFIISFS